MGDFIACHKGKSFFHGGDWLLGIVSSFKAKPTLKPHFNLFVGTHYKAVLSFLCTLKVLGILGCGTEVTASSFERRQLSLPHCVMSRERESSLRSRKGELRSHE